MRYFLSKMPMERFVHGAAIHCDTFAHNIVCRYHGQIPIEIHPATGEFRSSILANPAGNLVILPELPPLERNRVMVKRVHGLLAVPYTDAESDTGTWATVRHAREIGLPIYIVRTDGRIVRDPSMDAPL